ncbi:MAG: UvrD-helicase domain-containing protein [Candidatus Krumholzibacteriia bacterium]
MSRAAATPAAEILARATATQRQAADPDCSVVLRAGAGSGKTKVLVDRYLRLCLGGTSPRAILAVTFTRKAAIEIKERLVTQAARFAVLPEPELREDLARLLAREPAADELRRAAVLFERLLEDLDALPVGTIHAFCQTLLGRFACEARLDPGFGVVEKTDELWDEALDRLEQETARDPAGAALLASLGRTPEDTRRELGQLLGARSDLRRWLLRAAREHEATTASAACAVTTATSTPTSAAVGWRESLAPALTELRLALFSGTPLADRDDPDPLDLADPLAAELCRLAGAGLEAVAAVPDGAPTAGFTSELESRGKQALEIAADLETAAGCDDPAAAMAAAVLACRRCLFTSTGTVRRFRTGRRIDRARIDAVLDRAVAPVQRLLGVVRRIDVYRDNRALLEAGLRALEIYEEVKSRDRVLDFHDLEERAWQLMTDPEEALHVQFRLDDALEHLLLDEFQDVNHNQWELLSPFVHEFLAGRSSTGRLRTVFVVGDVKQSIYRFRGARPQIFAGADRLLAQRDDGRLLALDANFRSLPAVVRGVGLLFEQPPLRDLLPAGEATRVAQEPVRDEGPGELVLVTPFAGPDGGDDEAAAAWVAETVAQIVAERTVVERDHAGGGLHRRPARWGDVLVLCRARTHVGHYEQALRERGIPILPAGRGTLAVSREVQDVLALLRWLVFPADETCLAAVLRSPFFRLPEHRVHELLAVRRGTGATAGRGGGDLWRVLKRCAGDADLAPVVPLLERWLGRVDREPPHALLRRIYRDTAALEAFAGARGEQAHFNLLRLLDLTLGTDLGPHPTLRRLARSIERAARTAGEEEAVHPGEEGVGRVRVMTIHGAKGLEAPFVVLVDADRRLAPRLERLALQPETGSGPVLYRISRRLVDELAAGEPAGTPAGLADALGTALREEEAESANLLYVALTRARDACWVVGAAGRGAEEHRDSFLRQLDDAATAAQREGAAPLTRIDPPIGGDDRTVAAPAAPAGPRAPARPAVPEKATVARSWRPPSLGPRIEVVSPSRTGVDDVHTDAAGEEQTGAAGDAGARDDASEQAGGPPPTVPGGAPPAAPGGAPPAAPGGAPPDRARERGERIHAWLQAAAESGRMPAGSGPEWDEAGAVFSHPDLAWIFHPEREGGRGLCEVPVIHRSRPAGSGRAEQRVLGAIDRLIVRGDRVDIIDYKSNQIASLDDLERLTDRYRPQLVRYREALAALWPERSVRCWILFTALAGDGRARPLVATDDLDRAVP